MEYYKAYDKRYKKIHELNKEWEVNIPSLIVENMINKYKVSKKDNILEIGCGEGRDTIYLDKNGYNVIGVDVSKEAIKYCKEKYSEGNFKVLDIVKEKLEDKFKFIYSIAVIHMLVDSKDRDAFYKFVYSHIKDDGYALVCSMGNGKEEYTSDISKAYDVVTREHRSGKIEVVNTSCRKVNWATMEKEISNNNLEIVEKGIVYDVPGFNEMMYVVLKKE